MFDKRLIIGILLLFVLCNSVNALPPTVDFTFVPNSPVINQTIIFDPSITTTSDLNFLNWQFDTDGNTNYTYNPNLFVDKFTDTNNTDLNIHNTDWNTVSESPLMFWYAKIFNNQAWLRTDTNGSNNFIKVTLQNHDNNVSSNGQTFSAKFQLIDLNYITGAESQVQNTILRPSDLNFLANLRFVNSSFDGDINAIPQYDGINLTNIVVNRGDYFEIRLTRKSSLVYDINFFRNGTNFASVGDQNINSDSMRFQFGMDTGGSGAKMTYMVDDFNVSGNATPINIDRNETHVFTTSGTKTVCLTAGNPDGNTTTCKQPVISGFVQLSVRDEENGTPLNGVLLTLGDTNATTGASGDANFITDSLTFPITLTAQKSGYTTRQFEYLSLNGLTQDYNLSLRDGNETTDIDFQFFAPDQTTKLTNRIIVAKKNGGVSGRIITDSSGFGNMDLNSQDSGYSFLIYQEGLDYNSGTQIQYTYGTITVTVNRPKSENLNVDISPNNFSLTVGGLGLQYYTGTLPISSIIILGNTVDEYTINIVDSNVDGQQYFARNYIAQAVGSVSTITINPYLIKLTDGINVNFVVKNISDQRTLPNIRIIAKTIITNLVTVEDQVTNAVGTATFTLISKKDYPITVTSPNLDINYFEGTITASHDSFTFWINYDTSNYGGSNNDINVTFTPVAQYIQSQTQIVNAIVSASFPISSVALYGLDNNAVIDFNQISTSPYSINIDLNVLEYDNNVAVIRLDVVPLNDNNISFYQTYYFGIPRVDVIEQLRLLKNNFSTISLFVLVIIIILASIVLLGSSIFGNNDSQLFVIAIIAGILWLIFFQEYSKVFILASIIGIFAWLWTRSAK